MTKNKITEITDNEKYAKDKKYAKDSQNFMRDKTFRFTRFTGTLRVQRNSRSFPFVRMNSVTCNLMADFNKYGSKMYI